MPILNRPHFQRLSPPIQTPYHPPPTPTSTALRRLIHRDELRSVDDDRFSCDVKVDLERRVGFIAHEVQPLLWRTSLK